MRAWLGVREDDHLVRVDGGKVGRHRRLRESGFRRNHHLSVRVRVLIVLLLVEEDEARGEEGKRWIHDIEGGMTW